MSNINNRNEYDHIKEEILQFISYKETTGAMLICGEWGSGKTFLLNKITDEISDQKKYKKDGKGYYFTKVSLFGIDSIQTLHLNVKKGIYLPTLTKEDPTKLEQAGRVALKLGSLVGNKGKQPNNSIDTYIYDLFSVGNTISTHEGNKNVVLIFDDLERISKDLDMSLFLGAINYYVEQKNIKTIIVANTDKINDPKFNEIQEKIISHAIRIRNIQEQAIMSMIENYHEKYKNEVSFPVLYKDFLISNKEIIIQLFNECSENNLRSIKYMLVNFERIYHLNLIQYNTSTYREVLSNILYHFGIYYLENRKNKLVIGKNGNIQLEKICEDPSEKPSQKEIVEIDYSKYRNYKSSYRVDSLINWIINNEFNEQAIVYELAILFENNSPEYKVLLSNIEDLEDSDINVILNEWIDKANKFDLCYKKEKSDGNTITIDELVKIVQKVNEIHKESEKMGLKFNLNKLDCEGIIKNIQRYRQSLEQIENISIPRYLAGRVFVTGSDSIIDEINKLNDFIEFNNNKNRIINMIKNDIMPYGNISDFIVLFDNELYELIVKKYTDGNTKNFQRNSLRYIVMFLLSSTPQANKDSILDSIDYTKKLLNDIEKYDREIIQNNQMITHLINKQFLDELYQILTRLRERRDRISEDFSEFI